MRRSHRRPVDWSWRIVTALAFEPSSVHSWRYVSLYVSMLIVTISLTTWAHIHKLNVCFDHAISCRPIHARTLSMNLSTIALLPSMTLAVESLSDEPNPFAGAVAIWPRHWGPNVLRRLFTLQSLFLLGAFCVMSVMPLALRVTSSIRS